MNEVSKLKELKEILEAKENVLDDQLILRELLEFNQKRFKQFRILVNELVDALKKYDETLCGRVDVDILKGNPMSQEFIIALSSRNNSVNRSSYLRVGNFLHMHLHSEVLKENKTEIINDYKNLLDEINRKIISDDLISYPSFWVPDATNKLFVSSYLDSLDVSLLEDIVPIVGDSKISPLSSWMSRLSFYLVPKDIQMNKKIIHRLIHQCPIDDGEFEMYTYGLETFIACRKIFGKASVTNNNLSLLDGITIDKKELPEDIQKKLILK